MNTFEYKGETFAIIEGAVYVRLSVCTPVMPALVDVPRRRGRRPKKHLNQVVAETMERRRRKRLGPEAEETIRVDLEAGMGLTEACKKYDISVSTYYRLKDESHSKPVREEQLTETL